MALQKDITFKGVFVQNAYIRASVLSVTKTEIAYLLAYYAQPENEPLHSFGGTCPHDLEGGNAIAQVYAYVKTLPEFSDAIDL